MDLLLDTHAFIWWTARDPRLLESARSAIADAENRIVVSATSVWEISIKRASGKLAFRHDILEVLARETPGIAVLAEERGGVRADSMWAVDPLDGTTNFTRGFPIVAVSVSLVDAGVPVVGVCGAGTRVDSPGGEEIVDIGDSHLAAFDAPDPFDGRAQRRILEPFQRFAW